MSGNITHVHSGSKHVIITNSDPISVQSLDSANQTNAHFRAMSSSDATSLQPLDHQSQVHATNSTNSIQSLESPHKDEIKTEEKSAATETNHPSRSFWTKAKDFMKGDKKKKNLNNV